MAQDKEIANSNKFKSPVKGKSKFTDCSTKKKDKYRKTLLLDNLNGNEKEQLSQDDNKRKKEKHINLDRDEKEQL